MVGPDDTTVFDFEDPDQIGVQHHPLFLGQRQQLQACLVQGGDVVHHRVAHPKTCAFIDHGLGIDLHPADLTMAANQIDLHTLQVPGLPQLWKMFGKDRLALVCEKVGGPHFADHVLFDAAQPSQLGGIDAEVAALVIERVIAARRLVVELLGHGLAPEADRSGMCHLPGGRGKQGQKSDGPADLDAPARQEVVGGDAGQYVQGVARQAPVADHPIDTVHGRIGAEDAFIGALVNGSPELWRNPPLGRLFGPWGQRRLSHQ